MARPCTPLAPEGRVWWTSGGGSRSRMEARGRRRDTARAVPAARGEPEQVSGGLRSRRMHLHRSVVWWAIVAGAVVYWVLAPGAARAGAWTQNEGGWFLKLGYDQRVTSQRFDSSGAIVPYRTPGPPQSGQEFRSRALRAYAEYGLASSWTAVASGGYEWLESAGHLTSERSSGLSEPRLQLKWRLFERPLAGSLIGEVKLPLSGSVAQAPALGNGKLDYGGRVALGASTGKVYATTEVGLVVRGGQFTNQVPFAAEAGWSVLKDVLVRAGVHGTGGPGKLSANGLGLDPAFADSREVTTSVGLVLRGRGLDFSLEAERVLTGRNALAGTRLEFSIWFAQAGRER